MNAGGGCCFLPRDLPHPGIKPGSPALQADSLPSEPPWRLQMTTSKNQRQVGCVPVRWERSCGKAGVPTPEVAPRNKESSWDIKEQGRENLLATLRSAHTCVWSGRAALLTAVRSGPSDAVTPRRKGHSVYETARLPD